MKDTHKKKKPNEFKEKLEIQEKTSKIFHCNLNMP